VRDRQRAGLVRRRREVRRRLQIPEEVGLLEDDPGRVSGSLGEDARIRRAARVRHLDHLETESRRVRLDDLPHLWVRRLGDDDLCSARRVLRHVAGVGRHGRPVVAGCVGDVHAGQLADRGLVLVDGLQDALTHLRLVRRVGGQELAARKNDVHDRGDVVVVDSRAEERELPAGGNVPLGELGEVGGQLRLRERALEIQLTLESNAGRDVREEVLDGRDPDRCEHLVAIGVDDRQVAHSDLR
jgi:hypothetical protein